MSYPYGGLTLPNVDEFVTSASVSGNFERVAATSAGSLAPTSPPTGQLWYDTTVGSEILKINIGTQAAPIWSPIEAGATVSSVAPVTPIIGQFWFDTTAMSLKVWNGAWALTGSVRSSVSGTAPTSPVPVIGDLWYDTNDRRQKIWTGSVWTLSESRSIISASAPTSPTPLAGTIWQNSTTGELSVYDGTTWNSATPAATDAMSGKVELATLAEVVAGVDTIRAVTPAGLKPVVDAKANLASPTFTGAPTAPTATAGTNTTQIATTAFVQTQLTTGLPNASETLAGKIELATASEVAAGTDSVRAVTPAGLKPVVDLKSNLASPTFTGTPAAPTAATGTNTTQLATTAFVQTQLSTSVPTASETEQGKVELATSAETSAGTDTTRAVTPAGVVPLINLRAPIASPVFTGTPTAPTPAAGTNTTQIATTAFVQTQLTAGLPNATETLAGKVELATLAEVAAGTDATRAVTPAGLKPVVDLKSNLASPTFTGTPAGPTATAGTNTTQLATTAFVQAGLTAGLTPKANTVSPTFTGTPSAPTATAGTNTTQIATTAFVQAGLTAGLTPKANTASPTFTGTPSAPTAATGTNTTQIATTEFVQTQLAASVPIASVTVQGKVELATSAEVSAGTDTTRAVTPAGVTPLINLRAPIASPNFTGIPTAPTATSGTNTTQLATTAFVQAAVATVLGAIYPIGSIYINATNSTNPGALLGFGTWVAFGSGRMMVGQETGDTPFNVPEDTGGSRHSVVVSHDHTATTGVDSPNHTHSFNVTTSSVGDHRHSTSIGYVGTFGPGGTFSPMGKYGGSAASGTSDQTNGAGSHFHTVSGNTDGVSVSHSHPITIASTGSTGFNANLPPYIVVRMWKRTA